MIFNIIMIILILMNEIIKENYAQETLIYDEVEKLPNYLLMH